MLKIIKYLKSTKVSLAIENQSLRKKNNTLKMKLEEAQAINGMDLEKFLKENEARKEQSDYYANLVFKRNEQIKKLKKEILELRGESNSGQSKGIRKKTVRT